MYLLLFYNCCSLFVDVGVPEFVRCSLLRYCSDLRWLLLRFAVFVTAFALPRWVTFTVWFDLPHHGLVPTYLPHVVYLVVVVDYVPQLIGCLPPHAALALLRWFTGVDLPADHTFYRVVGWLDYPHTVTCRAFICWLVVAVVAWLPVAAHFCGLVTTALLLLLITLFIVILPHSFCATLLLLFPVDHN